MRRRCQACSSKRAASGDAVFTELGIRNISFDHLTIASSFSLSCVTQSTDSVQPDASVMSDDNHRYLLESLRASRVRIIVHSGTRTIPHIQ
jgi:hypothetical protein